MTITETKIYNISSQSASYTYNSSMKSNMIFFIPNFLLRNDAVENIYFSVLSAEIPNSFYLINQYNNILVVSLYTIPSTQTYTIPYGNYTINSLLTTLQSLMTGYTITYSTTTLKITISHPTNIFKISSSSTITRIMGLDSSTDTYSAYINSVYTLTCPYVVNLLPQQKIHFRSSNLLLDNYNTYDGSTDIFLSLQNNTNLGQGIYYMNNNSNNRFLMEIDHLQQFDIKITDDQNRLLDFNNCNWYMTLKIDYELKERIPRLYITDYLKQYQERQKIDDPQFKELRKIFS